MNLREDEIEILKKIAAERQAYELITAKLKTWWVWALVAGVMSVFTFWDAIKFRFGAL